MNNSKKTTKKSGILEETRVELRKVTWPTGEELLKNTTLVLTVVIFFALLVWGLDTVLSWALSLLLK